MWQWLHETPCPMLLRRWSWVSLVAPSLWKAVEVSNARSSFSHPSVSAPGYKLCHQFPLYISSLSHSNICVILHELQVRIIGSLAQGPENSVLMVISLVWGTEFNSPLQQKCESPRQAVQFLLQSQKSCKVSQYLDFTPWQILAIALGAHQRLMGTTSLALVLYAFPRVSHSDASSISTD